MPTGYALVYISPGNSCHRCYDVFFIDPDRPEIISRMDIGTSPMDADSLGKLIARYQMDNKDANPISFNKPDDFPYIGQLALTEGSTIPAIFEELNRKELSRAQKSMMKTLKGE